MVPSVVHLLTMRVSPVERAEVGNHTCAPAPVFHSAWENNLNVKQNELYTRIGALKPARVT